MTKTEKLGQFKLSLFDALTDQEGNPLVAVRNHYITREDHPCFGTRVASVQRLSSGGITLEPGGHTKWPKAAGVDMEGSSLVLYDHPNPGDRFLTITPIREETQ